jgi:hypothetical protein
MSTFNQVIRKDPLNGDKRIREPHEGKVVVVDAKRGTTLPAKPLLTFGRDLKYWLVRAEQEGEGILPAMDVKDFAKDNSLRLTVNYRGRCQKGNEPKVALALGKGEDPTAALHLRLEEWTHSSMRELQQEKRDPVGDFFAVRSLWQDKIAARAVDEVGLSLMVRLEIEGEKQLGILKLNNQTAQVRVMDYAESLSLLYSADLEVDPRNLSIAVLSLGRRKELEQAIADEIRMEILNCSLHQFCFGLDRPAHETSSETVREGIKAKVTARVAAFGRKLSFFALQHAQMNWLPQQTYEIRHEVSCEIDKYPQPVTVRHTLVLTLKDVGRFMARRLGDVKDHFQKELGEITRKQLLKVSYVDLLLKFPDYSAQIEQKVSAVAADVGLGVDQLISIPNLREIEWRDKGFEINVTRPFDTKVTAVKVEVTVVGHARLSNLEAEKVKPRIDRSVDIPAEVHEVVAAATAAVLHRTEPERYYLEFTASHDGDYEKGVEFEIRTAVKKELAPYAIEDLRLAIKQSEDKLKRRYDELVTGTHTFEVEALSYRESAAPEKVTCEIEFQVRGVAAENWPVFIGNKYPNIQDEIAAITNTFKRDVKDKLATMPIETLRWTDYRTRSAIEAKAVVPSVGKIRGAYGLILEVINFGRQDTLRANERLNKVNEIKAIRDGSDVEIAREQEARRKTELSQLEDRRLKLQASGIGDEDELKMLHDRIKELTDDHSARAIVPHQAAFEPAPPDSSKASFSFDDFTALPADVAKQLPQHTETGGESPKPVPRKAGQDGATEVVPPEKDE